MKMRRFISSLVCACLATLSFAQSVNEITGVVTDIGGVPLPFANTMLLSEDSIFVTGVLTDEYGAIRLQTTSCGRHILTVKCVGYESLYKDVDVQSNILLDTLRLRPASYLLRSVEVTAKTPMIRREADKVIFDPKNVAAAVNAVDLLRVTPGVAVMGDNVNMFSAQGVKFYINGKEQKMGNKEMLQVLRSYPANDIDKIELMASPSAKYAADGKAGIINLVLKKRENNFIGGSVTYAHTKYEEDNDEANANLIYNRGKAQTAIYVGGNWGDAPYKETNTQDFADKEKHAIDRGLTGKDNYFVKGQFDYGLSDNWDVGAYALYAHGKRKLGVDSDEAVAIKEEEPYESIRSLLDRREKTDALSINLNALQRIGNQGKTIQYNVDYYRLDFADCSLSHTNNYNNCSSSTALATTEYVNDISQVVDNYSGKIDVSLPWKNNSVGLGTHFSYVKNKRKLDYDNSDLATPQLDDFKYDEYVWALYAEYRRQFTDKFSANVGLRMESTWTRGVNNTTGHTHDNDYLRVFPSFFLSYNPNHLHSFSLSLTNQVTRPNVNHVNPNTIQRDRYSMTVGNPNLKASYFTKGMLGYTYKGVLTFESFYAYEPGVMTNVASIDEQMVRTTRWENCVDRYTAGLNTFYYFAHVKWLSLVIIQGITYERTTSSSVYTLPKEHSLDYSAMVNAQVFFDNSRHFIGNLWGNYTSVRKSVTSELEPMYQMGAGVQYNCLKGRLSIGLNVDNILASHVKGKEYANGVVMRFDNKFNYFMPRLSVAYNWGANLQPRNKQYESDRMKERIINDF